MAGPYRTISELVDDCAPADDEQRVIWLRRARELSKLQILPVIRRLRKGSGRHHLYDAETRWLAAVLLRMTDQRAPVGCLRVLADLVDKPARTNSARNFKQFWQAAKNSSSNLFSAHYYVAFAETHNGMVSWATSPVTAPGPLSLPAGSWVVTNLTLTFQKFLTQEE